MRVTDQFGYDVTVTNADAVPPWNKTVMAFLAHGAATPEYLTQTLQEDQSFALAQAARGFFNLLLGRSELLAVAQEALTLAEKSSLETPLTRRETAYVQALRHWTKGWPSRAADELDTALVEFPEDALLVKLIHAIRFVLGQPVQMRRSIETVLNAYTPNHAAYGFIKGCHAFALEETGEYGAAERTGRGAVEHQPDDAWGLHAVAHVYDMCGESDQGIQWLDAHPQGWSHCNNFGYHVWWHLGLLHLDKGNTDRVLDLYDSKIRADHTDDYRDISNGASMLMRLELEGVNVGGRWEELAALSTRRMNDGCNVFADLHYLMALARSNHLRDADSMLKRMQATAEQGLGELGAITARSGLPAAEGILDFNRNNYFSAFVHLKAAHEHLQEIGGSHAQRDVFFRLLIEAALNAGLAEEAQALIAERTTLRGAFDNYAKSRSGRAGSMSKASTVMQDANLRATPR
ncbi:tetratricopeptide repeat protein [Pseudovibrio exalbescens]|uniref:Tetratricopeptide repeat protein 38 n=1 Tax=Pseudovibrio exalbescens TaxID=197461 RepID=A0A1U7JHW5_9HYPH|nr:tetratricopeptide repeat protein [Pseudovibrio exalbescens]OKL44284.1 hypothetical protein A3843_07700 [Pseudovibrio exalbescens]